MSSRLLLPGFLLVLIPYIPSAAVAQTPSAQDGPLQQLDVSAGHWVYRGQSLGEKGARPSAWTWNEECRWSANHIFMLCSFSNTWGGKHVDSVVVDTYSRKDGAFWHYEIFNDSGPNPSPRRCRSTAPPVPSPGLKPARASPSASGSFTSSPPRAK